MHNDLFFSLFFIWVTSARLSNGFFFLYTSFIRLIFSALPSYLVFLTAILNLFSCPASPSVLCFYYPSTLRPIQPNGISFLSLASQGTPTQTRRNAELKLRPAHERENEAFVLWGLDYVTWHRFIHLTEKIIIPGF